MDHAMLENLRAPKHIDFGNDGILERTASDMELYGDVIGDHGELAHFTVGDATSSFSGFLQALDLRIKIERGDERARSEALSKRNALVERAQKIDRLTRKMLRA